MPQSISSSTAPARKITPFLWFTDSAEAAMKHYVSIFRNSRIVSLVRAGDNSPTSTDPVITGTFDLDGQMFYALNGGPHKFNESISLFVSCDTQAEIDELWEKLRADGGEEGRCGWLKDKFGLSWQIVPTVLPGLLGHPDRAKAGRAMQAMLGMKKLDIRALQEA